MLSSCTHSKPQVPQLSKTMARVCLTEACGFESKALKLMPEMKIVGKNCITVIEALGLEVVNEIWTCAGFVFG